MDKEFFSILIFGQKASKTRHLKIYQKTFKIGCYIFAFSLLFITFFLCDYIQVKKKAFELDRLRQETQTQKSQIQFFSTRIEDLEKQLSKLKDFDKKIRIIANLEKGHEATPLMGTGGTSPEKGLVVSKGAKDENKMVYQMRTDVERLRSEAMFQEESLTELEKLLQNKQEMLVHTPSIWPVQGWVTSGLGFRTNPFTGLIQFHEGLDIANQTGTSVVSPAHGIVSDIGSGSDWAYGKAVVISHGFGITTRYAHLNKVFVRVGQRVKRGEKIAEIGTSGRTTGPHLHYEVRINGIPANPMRYILN